MDEILYGIDEDGESFEISKPTGVKDIKTGNDIDRGPFWMSEIQKNGKKKIFLDKLKLIEFLVSKGIRKIEHSDDTEFVRIKNNRASFIPRGSMAMIAQKTVDSWDHGSEAEDLHLSNFMIDLLTTSLVSTIALVKQLPLFDRSLLLKDTPNDKYYFFRNKIVHINRFDGTKYIDYDNAPGCVWENNIIDRDIDLSKKIEGDFCEFIKLLAPNEEWRRSIETGIGFMCHTFKPAADAKMVVIYEENYAGLGGTGKSLIAKACKNVVNLLEKAGKIWNPLSDNALTGVNLSTDILYIDDLKEKAKLADLYNYITGDVEVNGKYMKTKYLSYNEFPKLLASSNHILNIESNADKRRVHEIFISNHFGEHLTPVEVFNKEFWGGEWTEKDWSQFYNYMIHCSKQYFKHGLTSYRSDIIEERRVLEKDTTLIELIKIIIEEAFENTTLEIVKATPKDIIIAGQSVFMGDERYRYKFKTLHEREVGSCAES